MTITIAWWAVPILFSLAGIVGALLIGGGGGDYDFVLLMIAAAIAFSFVAVTFSISIGH